MLSHQTYQTITVPTTVYIGLSSVDLGGCISETSSCSVAECVVVLRLARAVKLLQYLKL